MMERDYMQEHWFQQLKKEVAERGVVIVAEELGYKNHSGTSRILKGTYGDHRKFAKRVLATYSGNYCHHVGRHVQRSYCAEHALGDPPTHSPPRMAHWHACRRCEHRPEN